MQLNLSNPDLNTFQYFEKTWFLKVVVFVCVVLVLSSCNRVPTEQNQLPVQGIDVSHYQNEIDWKKVSENETLKFVFVKASEGAAFQDSFYCKNWEALAETELLRGAYHFFRPNVEITQQIDNYFDVVKLELNDLPPVLDVEHASDLSREALKRRVKEWLIIAEQRSGKKPILYTSQSFYYQYLVGDFHEYPLWIARYSQRSPQLEVERDWVFWQYSNLAKLSGINGPVDLNAFNGSEAQLRALCVPQAKMLTLAH